MNQAQWLQLSCVVLLNGCFYWIVGTRLARFWLRSNPLHEDLRIGAALRRSGLVAVGLGCVAAFGILWAEAAVMADTPLVEAMPMLPMMLSTTTYGQAGLVGLTCLLCLFGLEVPKSRGSIGDFAAAVLLVGFCVSRAMVSHAAESGIVTVGFVVELVHLSMTAVWVGGVAIGGWIVLPVFCQHLQQDIAIDNYLNALSSAATVALIAIVASGIFNAWYRVGTISNLIGNVYGTALIVKLIFVAVAVALGAFNRFIGFPAFAHAHNKSVVVKILRLESMLLLGALVAAALLTSQQPPTAM